MNSFPPFRMGFILLHEIVIELSRKFPVKEHTECNSRLSLVARV